MVDLFHVTSSKNRELIERHGLDWRRTAAAPGIAGSTGPEEHGIFLCLGEHEARFFVMGNNTGGPVDVWAVEGVELSELHETSDGFWFLPRPIPRRMLRLHRKEVRSVDDLG